MGLLPSAGRPSVPPGSVALWVPTSPGSAKNRTDLRTSLQGLKCSKSHDKGLYLVWTTHPNQRLHGPTWRLLAAQRIQLPREPVHPVLARRPTRSHCVLPASRCSLRRRNGPPGSRWQGGRACFRESVPCGVGRNPFISCRIPRVRLRETASEPPELVCEGGVMAA